MADENQKDSTPSGEPSSAKEELFSGDLESPEGDDGEGSKTQGSEPPAPEPKKDAADGKDKSEDSELEGIFTDLEKEMTEAEKARALNVKKKLQGHLTKKTQAIAEERRKISQELEGLKANQITDEFKQDYTKLFGWYQRIQSNPQEGIRELATQLGVKPEALSLSAEAPKPTEAELLPSQLETKEDYAKYVAQEVRKAVEEIRTKEVNPLKDSLGKFEGNTAKRELEERGYQALEEATKLPGFLEDQPNAEGKRMISKIGQEAINAVLKQEFTGPNALKNAYKSALADQHEVKVKEHESKVKELEGQLASLKTNIAGAGNAPKETHIETKPTPSTPKTFWKDMRSEPLTP